MSKEIQLTQGQIAIVDDEDYEYLSQWKWCAHYDPKSKVYYAIRSSSRFLGKRNVIRMHRLVMGNPENLEIDHIDANGLNNQKNNLRACTHVQNIQNRKKYKNSANKYKGVKSNYHKWMGRITSGGEQIYLGNFNTPEEAARAYDKKAIELFGEFANLNFPDN